MKSIVMNSVIHNENLMESQDQIIRLFRESGIHCAVMKGSSVAASYPQPELRALGDIDLLIDPDMLGAACDILKREGYMQESGEHGFHIGFQKKEVAVELHFAISDMPDPKQAERIEELMQGALENVAWRSVDPYIFPMLTPERQALSLLLHMERHWVAGGIGLRQLLDWHTFVISNDENAWRGIMPALAQSGLLRLAMVFTAACISYLGLDQGHAEWCLAAPKQLVNDMMADVLESGNFGSRLAESSTSRMFYDLDRQGGTEPFLLGALRNVNRNIRNRRPICAKVPILLPFFWVYFPLRYWVRSLLGLRLKQSTRKIVQIAATRKKLYQELRQLL